MYAHLGVRCAERQAAVRSYWQETGSLNHIVHLRSLASMVRSPETNARLNATLIKGKNPPFLIFPINCFSPGCCGSWQNNAKDLDSKWHHNIDFTESKVSSLVAQAFGPSTPETGRQNSVCLVFLVNIASSGPASPIYCLKNKEINFHLII